MMKRSPTRLSKSATAKAPKRRILEAEVTTLALCKRAKNGLQALYKSEAHGDGPMVHTLSKAVEDGELLTVVFRPDTADFDGDTASRDVIKRFAHRFNRDHRQLNIEHEGALLTKAQAFVAESFIVAPGDARFVDWKDYDGNPVGDLTGAWATITRIEDPVLRKACRDGKLNGISLEGPAIVEELTTKAVHETPENEGASPKDETMTPEQMLALQKAVTDGVVGALAALRKAEKDAEATAAAEAATKAAELAKSQKPSYGERPMPTDVSTPEARENYLRDLRAYELRKAIAEGATSEKVAELFKAIDEVQPSDKDAKIESTDSDEVKKYKRLLFKSQKRSTQLVKADVSDAGGEPDFEAGGMSIAAAANAARGIVTKA